MGIVVYALQVRLTQKVTGVPHVSSDVRMGTKDARHAILMGLSVTPAKLITC
jgi:hypothetical protein